jgi:hypothetical protein
VRFWQLRTWVKKFSEHPQYAFSGNGQMKPEQLEIARLKAMQHFARRLTRKPSRAFTAPKTSPAGATDPEFF